MSNVHCEHRPVGQAALPAAQGGRAHLVTTVDVTAPVARAVGDAFPRRARGAGRLTREVLPVDGGAERAAPIQVVGNHRADHAVARGQVIGWVQPCCERDGLGRRRWCELDRRRGGHVDDGPVLLGLRLLRNDVKAGEGCCSHQSPCQSGTRHHPGGEFRMRKKTNRQFHRIKGRPSTCLWRNSRFHGAERLSFLCK